ASGRRDYQLEEGHRYRPAIRRRDDLSQPAVSPQGGYGGIDGGTRRLDQAGRRPAGPGEGDQAKEGRATRVVRFVKRLENFILSLEPRTRPGALFPLSLIKTVLFAVWYTGSCRRLPISH